MSELVDIAGARVLRYGSEGAPLDLATVNDFLGEAFFSGADLLAIPVERLGPDFLTLRSGVAGEVFQKFANYRLRCAIVGDIGAVLGQSRSLRDFVRETNKGQAVWFVADFEQLRARLEGSRVGPALE